MIVILTAVKPILLIINELAQSIWKKKISQPETPDEQPVVVTSTQ